MVLSDYYPTLRNDISIDDKDIYNQHTNLIKEKKYQEAVTLLSNNSQIDSVTASLLNSLEQKIYSLCQIKKEYYNPIITKQTEPTESEMKDKVIWQQEY